MKTILLADDDLDLKEAIQDLLQEEGFSVRSCSNGRQAIECLEGAKPDLLLIDGIMPVLSGLEALKEIQQREDLGDLPIVLMSADDPAGPQSEYKWTHFLKKPIQFEELLAVITRLTDPVQA